MIDADLLEKVKADLKKTEKEAYVPPMTDPAAAALAGGGSPAGAPMGAPPAAAAPMPPMGGMPGAASPGGMPPIDPALLAGVDPSLLASLGLSPEMLGMPGAASPGGMPPMGGAPVGPIGPEEPQVVQLSMADLQAILQEAMGAKEPEAAGEGEGKTEEASLSDISTRLEQVEGMMGTLFSGLGLPIPGADASVPGAPEALPAATPTEIAPPEAMSLIGPPPGAGGEIGGAAPAAPPALKQASDKRLLNALLSLRELKNNG